MKIRITVEGPVGSGKAAIAESIEQMFHFVYQRKCNIIQEKRPKYTKELCKKEGIETTIITKTNNNLK